MSKLVSSKIITNNQNLRKKIEKLRNSLMNEYREVFLIFQILERKRMEVVHYIGANSPLAIKKGPGGRRSIGFMTTTYNALNDVYNPSFWSSLETMVHHGIITKIDKRNIKLFFNKLVQGSLRYRKLEGLLKINRRIIDKYTNEYFLKEISERYDLGLSQDVKKSDIKGYIGDIIDALYSSDSIRLMEIAHAYKACKDIMKKYVIFYYLALNSNAPQDISEYIAVKFANQRLMSNVRRNLVENVMITTHVLDLLVNDPDPKIVYYAKRRLKEKDIFRTEIMRYPH